MILISICCCQQCCRSGCQRTLGLLHLRPSTSPEHTARLYLYDGGDRVSGEVTTVTLFQGQYTPSTAGLAADGPGFPTAPAPMASLCSAYPPLADQWKALDATGICSGSTAHLRFQEWVAAGVFLNQSQGETRIGGG